MAKRGWQSVAFWDLALVGGPLVTAGVLALNGWSLGNLRVLLLAVYGVELLLILLSGWQGILTARLRRGGYGAYLLKAPATDEIFEGPDPTDVRMGSQMKRDPIAMGPGLAVVVLLLSFAIWH